MKNNGNKKSRGLFAAVIVSALAIGLFSMLFLGANHFAFASTNNRTVLQQNPAAPHLAATVAYTQQPAATYEPAAEYPVPEEYAAEPAVFVPPTATLVSTTSMAGDIPPSHAVSMEEAFLIGAEYIWDVLGSCIDGMYVEMMYIVMPGFTRPFWIGQVTETMPQVDLNFEDFRDDPDGWIDAQVFALYHFRIDALTGMRVSVGYTNPSYLEAGIQANRERTGAAGYVMEPVEDWGSETDCAMQRREAARMAIPHQDFREKWFAMDIGQQLQYSDITQERLEAYTQTALQLAQRHFNTTTVENIVLGDAWVSANTFFAGDVIGEGDSRVMTLNAITFTATDHTGRELIVHIPTETASWRRLSVCSMHSAFVPGFNYDPDNTNLAQS